MSKHDIKGIDDDERISQFGQGATVAKRFSLLSRKSTSNSDSLSEAIQDGFN